MESTDIKLIITEKFPAFSFAPNDSDQWSNALVMEQIVGTLVKYGRSGNYEPYLAESWSTDANEHEWKFNLRKNLVAEDGKEITADRFVKSFKKMLRIYAKTSVPPTFSNLTGWAQFIAGDDNSLGITSMNSSTVIFKFNKRPSGVLEFLSMPYFGYFSEADLDQDYWRNRQSITSSGAYAVKSVNDDAVILVARNGWFSLHKNAPKSIHVSFKELPSIKADEGNAIVRLREKDSLSLPGWYEVSTTPSILSSLILSPFVTPFDRPEVRQAFREVSRTIFKRITSRKMVETPSNYFYQSFDQFSLSQMPLDKALKILRDLGKIKVSMFKKSNGALGDNSITKGLIGGIQEMLSWEINVITPEQYGHDWLKAASSNKIFPLRLTSVDIGGAPENWVIEMMFCGTLGVSFPDPNNVICKIVSDYEKDKFQSKVGYWKALHDGIESEACVIPLGHWGGGWLLTESIEKSSIAPTMNIPRFDLIELAQ